MNLLEIGVKSSQILMIKYSIRSRVNLTRRLIMRENQLQIQPIVSGTMKGLPRGLHIQRGWQGPCVLSILSITSRPTTPRPDYVKLPNSYVTTGLQRNHYPASTAYEVDHFVCIFTRSKGMTIPCHNSFI